MTLNLYYIFPSYADWHILNDQTTKSIAAYAPTTEDDLASLGVLGEQKMKEYGGRLVKVIKKFVDDKNLHEYISNRPPPPKRPRVQYTPPPAKTNNTKNKSTVSARTDPAPKPRRQTVVEVRDDSDRNDDDEFATDINFDLIDIP